MLQGGWLSKRSVIVFRMYILINSLLQVTPLELVRVVNVFGVALLKTNFTVHISTVRSRACNIQFIFTLDLSFSAFPQTNVE